jgi:hypothetical protein
MDCRSVPTSSCRLLDALKPPPVPAAGTAIGAFIDHWNEHPRPFAWTKDAEEILASINQAKTKAKGLTEH